MWQSIHKIIGLTIVLFLIFSAVTGFILAFEPAIYSAYYTSVVPSVYSVGQGIQRAMQLASEKQGILIKIQYVADAIYVASISINGKIFPFVYNIDGSDIDMPFVRFGIFETLHTVHRDMFMGKTGRLLLGITGAGLTILSISGLNTLQKRCGGWKKLLKRPANTSNVSHIHSIAGVGATLPLSILGITVVIMVLNTFNVGGSAFKNTYESDAFESTPAEKFIAYSDMPALQNIPWSNVNTVVMPDITDKYDVLSVRTKNTEYDFDKYSGVLLSQSDKTIWGALDSISYSMHTGRFTVFTSILWGIFGLSIILFAITGIMLFRKNSIANITQGSRDASIAILVGTQTDTTNTFATAFYKALESAGETVYKTSMNKINSLQNPDVIFIFTSTYGDGEAPKSATRFARKYIKLQFWKTTDVIIVGFGDKAFPKYCGYAYHVESLLKNTGVKMPIPLTTIDKANIQSFKQWIQYITMYLGADLQFTYVPPKIKTDKFTVISNTPIQTPNGSAHWIRLDTPHRKTQFQAGDIIAIQKNIQTAVRYYSIGSNSSQKYLDICVRKIENGICSQYLSDIKQGDTVSAIIKSNPNFHMSKYADNIIMIGAGTGVTPFVGMIDNNTQKTPITAIFGFSGQNDVIFKDKIADWEKYQKIHTIHYAYSREQNYIYVQDMILKNPDIIKNAMAENTVIMVCGSIAMGTAVRQALESIGIDTSNPEVYKQDIY